MEQAWLETQANLNRSVMFNMTIAVIGFGLNSTFDLGKMISTSVSVNEICTSIFVNFMSWFIFGLISCGIALVVNLLAAFFGYIF